MIEIVRASEHHISDVGKLWLEYMRFHQDIDPIFTPRDGTVLGFEEDQVRRLMKSEDGLVLVALDEGRVVGYSLSEIKGPMKGYKLEEFGHVHDVAVTASYRRRGIGEKMLGEIMKWFRSKNINRVELSVVAKNQVAYSFWRKHGFTDYIHTFYRHI
jgi:ribosomal protein S18 acetylase RimI-like enzyme